jgi:hypothetical protein
MVSAMNMSTEQTGTNGAAKLREMIAAAIAANPDKKACWKAMKAIKWALYCPQLGLYAGLRGIDIVPVTSIADAQVFDGRDNEAQKVEFYRVITGIDWQIQLVSK